MNFEFPEDTLMLREMLRRFLQKEVRPLEMNYFTSGQLKPEEQSRLRRSIEQLGLWGLTVPEQYGGGGLDLVTACMLEEELGGTFVPLEIGEVPALLYACSEQQTARYLEPALAGERRALIAAREPGPDGLRPEAWETRARLSDTGFTIDGRKVLARHPTADDFFILLARTPHASNGNDLTAFLMETNTPGISISSDEGLGGGTNLYLRDCVVGEQAVLGKPGQAAALDAQEAPRGWIRAGARYIGLAARLLEMGVEHANTWVSLGEPLAIRPAIIRMVAEIGVDIECSRWLVYHAAWSADRGGDLPPRAQAAQVRLATGEMLKRSIDKATMIFAGPGPSEGLEIQRFVHSVVPPAALENALEYARMVVAAQLLNLSEINLN